MLVIGCSASLSDGAWVWRKANEVRVDDSAKALNLTKDPTYWARCEAAGDTGQGTWDVKLYRACQNKDADFIKACRALAQSAGGPAAAGDGLSDAEMAWCDGDPMWARVNQQAYSMGLVVQSANGMPLWELRGVSGDALRSEGDYARACNAAFEASNH